jgi:hypothetical protein
VDSLLTAFGQKCPPVDLGLRLLGEPERVSVEKDDSPAIATEEVFR